MSPHEPRCHQNGMDARRRDAAKAGRLGKERNDSDARFGGNPKGAGCRCERKGPTPSFGRRALLPRPGVYQHTASSAPSPALPIAACGRDGLYALQGKQPQAAAWPRSRSCGLMR